MSETCVNCELELNNDIMGIGVRAALYAQIFLGWAMSLIWPDTFIKNSRTAYMTATALLVASLIEWKTQNLSVLDALVVSLMSSMMTIFIVVSGTSRVEAKPTTQATPGNAGAGPVQTNTQPNSQPPNSPNSAPQPAHIRNRNPQQTTLPSLTTPPTSTLSAGSPVTVPQAVHPAPPSVQQQTAEQQAAAQASDPPEPVLKPRTSNTQWFIRFCFVNIWGGWCFNLWNDPVHFGLEGQRANCTTNNDVTIWVFGVELQAVSPGIRIAALVLVSILYFVAICSLFFTLEDVLDTATGMLGFIGGLFATDSLKRANPAPPAAAKRSLHDDPVLNRIHYFLHISAFGTLIYLVVSIEMTVRHNDKKQETMEWSFGQVIALILLLQQCMDFCSTYIEGRENKQAEREREERERKMAQRPSIITNQQGEDVPMKDLTPSTPNSSLPV